MEKNDSARNFLQKTNKFTLHACPCCYNYRLSITNNIIAIAPELKNEWDYKKNHPFKPEKVIASSGKKFWWICKTNPNHLWQAPPNRRVGTPNTKKNGCPLCPGNSNPKKILSNLYPKIAKLWHPTKNNYLLPSQVSIGSGRVIYWRCLEKNHIWSQPIIGIIRAT